MTGPRFILSVGLLSACTSRSGDLDAAPRTDGAPIADAGPTLADGATLPSDSTPTGPPESEFLQMARRSCDEICRCSPPDDLGWCDVRFPGCTDNYTITPEGCIRDFVNRMELLKSYCPGSDDPCNCQWLEECRHWALTAVCDPRSPLPMEKPSQCIEAGGPPSDRDPTCERGPLRQCDAGVR